MAEEILLQFRKSRKSYWMEYLSGFFLLGLLAIVAVKGINLPMKGYYFVGGLAMISIGSAESTRMLFNYKISAEKMSLQHGLISQTKRYIFVPSIADIDVKQTKIERLFNYGTIHLRSMSGEALQVPGIGDPYAITGLVEELVQKYKKGHHDKGG